MDKMRESKSPSCGEAISTEINKRWNRLTSNFSRYHWDFVFDTPQKLSALSHDTAAMVNAMAACARELDPSLNRISISPSHRLTFILSGLSSYLPSGDMTLDQFVQLILAAKTQLREYERQFDRQQLRYYSAEDQADEVAASVLKSLKLTRLDYAQALLGSLEEDKALCETTLNKNIEPPYGHLVDIHHATCWRVWHLREFERNSLTVPGLK